MDATCSGLQVLSILMRDENTAKKVNVLPSEKPQDIYSAVAEKVKAEVELKASQGYLEANRWLVWYYKEDCEAKYYDLCVLVKTIRCTSTNL